MSKWKQVKRAELVAARAVKKMLSELDGTQWSKKWGPAHSELMSDEDELAESVAKVLLAHREFKS